MNKIYYILIMVLVLSSCDKKFQDLNTDPKNPSSVPSETLFTSAQKQMGDQVASTSVNFNNFKLWSQYFTETTYTDESNYDVITRNVPDNAWTEWYRDVISDLTQAKFVLSEETVIPGEEQKVKNKEAILDLLIVFTYQRLVDMFGNVPYTEAMDVNNNLLPAYDDAWEIYQSLANRIDDNLANMDASAGSFGGADLMYGGDVASWMAFANGMKLKMGITVVNFNTQMAQTWMVSAAPHVFSSSADNCTLEYLGATPNTNPQYVSLVLSGRHDYVAGKTIIDTMNFYNDPRRAEYYTQVDTSGNGDYVYLGGGIGESNTYGDFSHHGPKLLDPTHPVVLMSYSEIQFYLAEAAERGFSVGGSAQGFYENAINASFDEWGAADAATYLGQDDVAWGTGTHTNMEKIARESWVSFYDRGFVAYTQIRRLDFPLPIAASPANGIYPLRYTYPVNEQTLNGTSYTAAASAIGGDTQATHIFWDN